jgi:predicted GNAT superfamily acetyltransferase
MPDQRISIRSCHTIAEFEQMVELESQVWGFTDRDLVPSQMYTVADKVQGQVLGAFAGDKLAGFVLAYPGIRQGVPYLHSHMAAVLPELQDLGIGRLLKLAQRDEALSRGISLIEWTFDPLQLKNAYFNICRLGVLVRRYLPDVYGSTSSPLHAGLPTDRLVAEWYLASARVRDVLSNVTPAQTGPCERIKVDIGRKSEESLASAQTKLRLGFQELFGKGYSVTWFEKDENACSYVLEPAEVSGQ